MDKEWENIYQVKWTTRAGKGDGSEESGRPGTIQVTMYAAWLANGTFNEDWKNACLVYWNEDKELVPNLQYENRISCFLL